MERRTLQVHRPRLVRSADGKATKITGYAAVFYNAADAGTQYELFSSGNYSVVERLMPGCFDRALRERQDVAALYNHDANAILGRVSAGTLRLSVDGKGLRYEIDPPDTQIARDLMASLQRGDVKGSSFAFNYVAKSVVMNTNADGSEQDIINVTDLDLFDVGPVVFPAYESTTSGVRGKGDKPSRLVIGIRAAAMLRDLERLGPVFARRRTDHRAAGAAEGSYLAQLDGEVALIRQQHAEGVARRRFLAEEY
jgi:HK97 family phage prohead protease